MVKKAVKLKLEIEQEDGTFKPRTFTQSKVSSRVMYNIMDFYDKAEKNELSTMEAIDAMIDIVVNTFRDPAVTFDSILDGLEAKDLAPTLQQVLQEINELGDYSAKK